MQIAQTGRFNDGRPRALYRVGRAYLAAEECDQADVTRESRGVARVSGICK